MKKQLVLAVLLVGLALVLTACGGGPKASTDLKVAFTDFTFTPTTFTIPAGKEITLTATNNGKVVHEFVIMKAGTAVSIPFGDDDEGNIYWEVEAEPGKTVTGTFTAPSEPGEYQLICGTEGHVEAGMMGKVIVVAP